MSVKWTSSQSESGILRKSEFKEKKEELFVFGYSCKLFRDDDKALQIDQGKHLIPWMGDETLKIDRYDARGALHDLGSHEAPPGGFDWRVELSRTEQEVEQLCDEERYRALHTDEDEEEMYKEEELKRLHAAGYGQVGFNYDTPVAPEQPPQPVEIDEPFIPTLAFKALLPSDLVLPDTEKQNVIIDKTAKFIAAQGAQMEILIKAKQGDNPQFQFLNRDSVLHPYYTTLIALVKAGKWPEKKQEVVEEKPPENEDYLHPSLASTIIESAPSIPSIHYKPSADCDYTMLISKMRGSAPGEEPYSAELAPGEEPPPGTEPLPPRVGAEITRAPVMYSQGHDPATQLPPQPPNYTPAQYQQYLAYYQQYQAANPIVIPPPQPQPQPQSLIKPLEPLKTDPKPVSTKSTGLSLMKNYNTDSDSDVSDCDDTSSTDSKDNPVIETPPEEVQTVIDKMADYVARNGAEFADIVRAKGDPRFSFLEPSDQYHAYYCSRLAKVRNGEPLLPPKKPSGYILSVMDNMTNIVREKGDSRFSFLESSDQWTLGPGYHAYYCSRLAKVRNGEPLVPPKKPSAPVSFSIKKLKEPDPILPKPALPYESSSEDETDANKDKNQNKEENVTNNTPPPTVVMNNIVPTVVYKMEGMQETDLPVVKTIETKPKPIIPHVVAEPKLYKDEKPPTIEKKPSPKVEEIKKPEAKSEKIRKRKASPRAEKKVKIKKREKSDYKEKERRRSVEREKVREEKSKKQKYSKDDLENEIISLEDNSDEMIDLTGDHSDSKADIDAESERQKQMERRRRAAEFLKKVGVDPGAAATLPTSSLASAMVDTLESIRKKKAEAEEKRRKREKRRHRDKYGYDEEDSKSHRKSKRRKRKESDEEDSEIDSSKKKKRRKEKKSSKGKKKKRREYTPELAEDEELEEIDHPLPPNINLTSTLKELRSSSPTKELALGLQTAVDSPQLSKKDSSSSDEEVSRRRKKKVKKEREYSEGEWSSDSEGDSGSEPSVNGD